MSSTPVPQRHPLSRAMHAAILGLVVSSPALQRWHNLLALITPCNCSSGTSLLARWHLRWTVLPARRV